MKTRKPIIVGIDPGVTTGYAVMDTDGNLLKSFSSKNLGLSELISDIIGIGKVIAVGTDKQKTPDLVYKFAAKFGARIINPKEDIRLLEKRRITKKYDTKNGHESDAIVSAICAYKEIKPTIEKINKLEKV